MEHKKWVLPEWRNPRKGDVVRDLEGSLCLVVKSQGDLRRRKVWAVNESGVEVYTDADPEGFTFCTVEETRDFNLNFFRSKNLSEGKVCSVKGYENVPMFIEKLEWVPHYLKMRFWLKDLRKPFHDPLKTENYELLEPFELEMPENFSQMLSENDSSLGCRINVNLAEIEGSGWTVSGSPLSFKDRETAEREVKQWFDRLRVRRLASVINADWKPKFDNKNVNFYVRVTERDNVIFTYVDSTTEIVGVPAYFKSALHAGLASTYLPPEIWYSASNFTSDSIDI